MISKYFMKVLPDVVTRQAEALLRSARPLRPARPTARNMPAARRARLEMLVPARDIVGRWALRVHRVLVKVAGVQVGLDAGHDGNAKGPLPQTLNRITVSRGTNGGGGALGSRAPSCISYFG